MAFADAGLDIKLYQGGVFLTTTIIATISFIINILGVVAIFNSKDLHDTEVSFLDVLQCNIQHMST